MSLLDTVPLPQQLRGLELEQLPQLCQELRAEVIESVARTGGHLASNLGVIELSVALHYVLDTPRDQLIWDVGHQCYAHKILTGRRHQMSTLRQFGGLSGFPRRQESSYDTFGTGHASTSISAALGMACGYGAEQPPRQVVAVIGDGALSGGMAFEALNNAGVLNSNVLVVLNDNEMSISRPVGAMTRYLAQLLSSRFYTSVRNTGSKAMEHLPRLKSWFSKAEEHMRGMVMPGTLFEELGLDYFGPIDGHDVLALVKAMRNILPLQGPKLLHIVTQKGKGYERAEADPIGYHGVGKFKPEHGLPAKSGAALSYTEVFSQWLCASAKRDSRLVAITPAMKEGSGLVAFAEAFPERYYDVGIAEQHALTFAAGLATTGVKPVVAIYSTFLQRAYDQLIHDVLLQQLPVMLAIDRAGLVGADGGTHHGAFDISFLRCLPNLVLMAPADEQECWLLLNTAYALNQPSAVRYPRGVGPGVALVPSEDTLPLGQARTLRQGNGHLLILSFGPMLALARPLADTFDATLVDMRFIQPLDEKLLAQLLPQHQRWCALEDNVVAGGAGSAVAQWAAQQGHHHPHRLFGLPRAFVEHGDNAQLWQQAHLTLEDLTNELQQFMA